MKLGIAVLGATGYIGTPYRDEIREAGQDTRIVTLCARRRDRLEAAKHKDNADLITDDWQAAIEHPEVNCVVIATPDALHFEPVMACAALDKHVFCEKPPAFTAKDVEEIRCVEKESGKVLMYGFNHRYHESVVEAFRIIQSKEMGKVINLRGVYGKSQLITFNQSNWIDVKRTIKKGKNFSKCLKIK